MLPRSKVTVIFFLTTLEWNFLLNGQQKGKDVKEYSQLNDD